MNPLKVGSSSNATLKPLRPQSMMALKLMKQRNEILCYRKQSNTPSAIAVYKHMGNYALSVYYLQGGT